MLERAATIIAAVGLLFAISHDAAADAIAWDKVIGANVSKLKAAEKTKAADFLARIKNTHGCQGTLAHCLAEGDLTARRHAGFVIRMVRKNKEFDYVSKGVGLREKSARPDEKFEIDLTDHPHMGDPKAKVTLVEYACFQCPYCAHLAPKLKGLNKKFGGQVVHYYKFFPVRSHENGVRSALAGLAAYRQGKFWKMYDQMYANRASLEDEDLEKHAKKAGLDTAKYQAAIADKTAMRYIEKDKLEGMRFGVEGTPTFYINGKQYVGSQDYPEIVDRIEEELEILAGKIK